MGMLPLTYYLLVSWFYGEKKKEKATLKDRLPFLNMITHPIGVEGREHGLQD